MKTKCIISTNSLNGCHYPQKAQGTVLRSFSIEKGWGSFLHTTSLMNDQSILEREVFPDSCITDLIFFSKLQVEQLGGREFSTLLEKLEKKLIKVHFALESDENVTPEDLIKLRTELTLILKNNKENIRKVKKRSHKENKVFPLITKNHISSKRDYSSRATDKKPQNALKAKLFEFDYWDGERDTGYGGYRDDGRWKTIAAKIIEHYKLCENSSLLDIGCGKGYLLKELRAALPKATIVGLDVSKYAIENAASQVKEYIIKGSADSLPFSDNSFDFVFSNMTLHNLELPNLFNALSEIERISKGSSWIGLESYRNEQEKWNLMRWQLTCECFFTPNEWLWAFQEAGYTGDYELIYFD